MVSRPLEGKRVVNTRAREQSPAELSAKLRAHGAIPIEWPMIEIAPPENFAPLDDAIRHLSQYDWIVFSSANGVKYFWNRLDDCQMRFPRIAAVGEKTAEALRRNGLQVDAKPDEFLASNIAAVLGDIQAKKILVLRPDIAPPDLTKSLEVCGAHVTEVVAYCTVPVTYNQPLDLNTIDAITFASASAAKSFANNLHGQTLPDQVCVATIGPSTTKAARQAGLKVDAEAREHTLEGLSVALVQFFQIAQWAMHGER